MLAAFLLMNACKDDKGAMGLDMQPEEELLNTDFFDTTSIAAVSMIDTGVATSELAFNVLGLINDPIFGGVTANIYAQFRFTDAVTEIDNSAVADSAFLNIAYTSAYGDTNNALTFEIYKIDSAFDFKRGNKDNIETVLPVIGTSLVSGGSFTFKATPHVYADSASIAVVSIPLSLSFATELVDRGKRNQMVDNYTFSKGFKGLLIKATTAQGSGCAVVVSMRAASNNMKLYYHDAQSSKFINFIINSDSSASFASANHQYASADVDLQSQFANSTASTTEKLFLQTLGGAKIRLNFPYLKKTFEGKKVIIHRAVLVGCVANKDTAYYPIASFLAMRYYDQASAIYKTIPDYELEGAYGGSLYDGGYNRTLRGFRLGLTQYIQNLIDSKGENYPLDVLISGAAVQMSRMVLYGTDPSGNFDKRFRLEINYTIVK